MAVFLINHSRIPNSTLKILQRLGKTLIRDSPEPANYPFIDEALAKLVAEVVAIDAALVERHREVNPQILASEVDFDRATDVGWVWVRKLLEGFRDLYSHPGLSVLPPALQQMADLPTLRQRGDQARLLHDRLFGANGTKFVTGNFLEQSETMGTLLRMIEDDGLVESLASVIGVEPVRLLSVMQIHYEDMVATRMGRERGPGENLRELRAKLRFRLDRYVTMVEALRDPDLPENDVVVARALRSLYLLTARMNAGASPAEIEEFVDEEFVESLDDDDDSPESSDLEQVL